MNTKMKLKNILTVPLTISLAVLLTACTHPNNDVPIQSNGDGYDNQYYQNPPITTTDASYSKPVVVVNKHYYQTKPKVRVSRYKRK